MNKKLVSIIIVNWNGKAHLEKCLPSLFKQQYKKIEVILVDNASMDGSVEYVKKNFPKTIIIINKKNLGFAEANNIGYRVVKGEYILFLNNDTYVTDNFLINLLRVLNSDLSIGGVQSKIFFMDDKERLDAVGSFLTSSGFLYHYGFAKKDSKIYDRQIDIYSAKGAAMIFKREVLEKVKVDKEIFDSRYFAYFEETDLCHRVWMAGYKIAFVPSSKIYHKIGATSSKLDNSFVQYHSFKNRINSYLKNLGAINLFKIFLWHLFLCEIVLVMYLLRRKFSIAWAIKKAILWNLINISATLRKRYFIQSKIRTIDDRIFFPIISKNVPLGYHFYTFLGNLKSYKEQSL